MDGFCLVSGCFVESFGSSSCGCSEEDFDIFFLSSGDDNFDECCFSGSWAASNDHKFFVERGQDGLSLGIGEFDT